jgi:hypothetical protein
MQIEVKSWLTGEVILNAEAESLKDALEKHVAEGDSLDYASLVRARLVGARLVGASLVRARLVGARLDGARLDGARLDGASLDGARLVGARLDGARLVGASLVGARLDGARLVGASLDGASLVGASLDGARLDGARLVGARLDGASLVGARLDGANLTPIRDDLWAVLSSAPAEVEGLRLAIIEGRIEGSTYEGECACLVGTIANVRHENYLNLGALRPNSYRPAECFFLAIHKGDTPETNQFSKLALEWVDQWLSNVRTAFGASVQV